MLRAGVAPQVLEPLLHLLASQFVDTHSILLLDRPLPTAHLALEVFQRLLARLEHRFDLVHGAHQIAELLRPDVLLLAAPVRIRRRVLVKLTLAARQRSWPLA
eukprot:1243392-Prymnesium_polylepis.1